MTFDCSHRLSNGKVDDERVMDDIQVMTERAIAQINLLSTQFDDDGCGRIPDAHISTCLTSIMLEMQDIEQRVRQLRKR